MEMAVPFGLSGLVNLLLNREFVFPEAIPFSALRYILSGLCIGVPRPLGGSKN